MMTRSTHAKGSSPVDVSAIRVDDEVTVRGKVVKVAEKNEEGDVFFRVEFECGLCWFELSEILHTTAPRPATLAEFKALPLEVQERLFAEMVKWVK